MIIGFSSKELRNLEPQYGAEIDIRAFGSKLILNHDPYMDGENLIDYLDEYRNGTLILNVQKGFSLLIQMKIPELLNRINNFIGYKAINEIKIKQVDLKN